MFKYMHYFQLCLIGTEQKCNESNSKNHCYCTPTEAANVYLFVLNISSYPDLFGGKIKAMLMYVDSTEVSAEILVPEFKEATELMETAMTINGKDVGQDCKETINVKDNELNIEASCLSSGYPCYLELLVEGSNSSHVRLGNISFQNEFYDELSLQIHLRTSRCAKGKFVERYTCNIEIVAEQITHEESFFNDTFYIATIASVAVVLIIIIILAIVIFRRRRHQRNDLINHQTEALTNLTASHTSENHVIEVTIPPEKPKRTYVYQKDTKEDNDHAAMLPEHEEIQETNEIV
ncbi:hypothetical protein Bpfe_003698 [Biomphalaria pfeifferi]|uniref:Uncharacterized protein n=1 Tax=Biomphalaria pfeifferi TaxID=112525 RepID=A0AAD8FK73_BIOPF|nr:hypothetical protein Bpfe_003698 [Biomphalaria pfeifferi]